MERGGRPPGFGSPIFKAVAPAVAAQSTREPFQQGSHRRASRRRLQTGKRGGGIQNGLCAFAATGVEVDRGTSGSVSPITSVPGHSFAFEAIYFYFWRRHQFLRRSELRGRRYDPEITVNFIVIHYCS